MERSLFFRLPDGSFLQGLTIIDEPSWKRPAMRGVLPFDEDDPLWGLNDDVHGGQGVAVFFHNPTAVGAENLIFHFAGISPGDDF